MRRTDWPQFLSSVTFRRSRRQRRALAARRRRAASVPVSAVQRLEERTLLAATHPLPLSSLDGTTGFRLDGEGSGDGAGRSVSSAGDVNGDGFDDVIVGAWFGDSATTNSTGTGYVVFGRSGGFASGIDLSSLDGASGFRLDGVTQSDYTGDSVSSAGDVNGDGFDDLIIGARSADPGGDAEAGSSYILFGKSGGFASVINLGALDGTTGFRLDGDSAGDRSGYSVSSAGDVNGDGFGDLIVGALGADPNGSYSGSSYVVFGKSEGFSSAINLALLNGSTGFQLNGVSDSDRSGRSVSSAGDVNGDGLADLIVGADRADSLVESGSSYVVFGRSSGFTPQINLSTLNGTTGVRLDGVMPFDRSGFSVSSAGDVNGDGFDDLITGAYNGDAGAGASYVVFGKSGGFASAINLSTLDGTTGFRLIGEDNDVAGKSVSGAGDVNGDGFDDLFVGDYGADFNAASGSGSSYVVFGKSGGFASAMNLSTLDGTIGFRLDGVAAGEGSGRPVSTAGDVNGDGFDDLIIGARLADPNGMDSGSSYVVFGGNFTGGVETQVAADGDQTLNATLGGGVDVLVGGRGNDTLISDGGDDVLRGGEGDDVLAIPDTGFSPRRLVGGNGKDTLRLDGSGLVLDLTSIADNRIVDVEQIDIRGNGANTLTLDVREVLNLSSHSNTLIVRSDTDDTVNFGGGWTQQSDEMIDGDSFEVFIQGAATLKIQVPPPFAATGHTVNGGSSNRSGIGTLAFTFAGIADVQSAGSLTLFNHTTGLPVDVSSASLSGDGSTMVAWNLSGLILPDGRYSAELTPSQVTTTGGGPLAHAHAVEFHVLLGDLDGDGFVNFNDTVPLSVNFGLSGTAYREGDGDGDGTVNFDDTVPLSLSFGASLAPLTYDFGDASETGTSFPTTLANNGARHIVTGNSLFLGAGRDAEMDGQPTADASGDGTDEDGLVFDPLIPGADVSVTVTSSTTGFLNGWVDFNQDGDWDDPGERVFDDAPTVAGANNLQITVPAGAALGSTFGRFRLTGSPGHSYFGLARSGEVEDYQLEIIEEDLEPEVDKLSVFVEASSAAMPVETPSVASAIRFLVMPAPCLADVWGQSKMFSTERDFWPSRR